MRHEKGQNTRNETWKREEEMRQGKQKKRKIIIRNAKEKQQKKLNNIKKDLKKWDMKGRDEKHWVMKKKEKMVHGKEMTWNEKWKGEEMRHEWMCENIHTFLNR